MEQSLLVDAFKLPISQLPRVAFHAIILATIIASFWILDSIKDPILNITIGIEYQPLAKIISLASTFLCVCIYDPLTSRVSRASLFYLISTAFGTIFFILAALLSHPIIGLSNISRSPHRLIGWIAYVSIECYGSLLVALFWSFTNTVMDVYLAKASYGVIISAAQIGAVLGSSVATNTATIGIPSLMLFGSVLILAVNLIIKMYEIALPQTKQMTGDVVASQLDVFVDDSWRSMLVNAVRSLYEGVTLIARFKYVLQLFGVTVLYEVLLTLVDYKFKVLGADNASLQLEGAAIDASGNNFVLLLGRFGQLTNLMSFCVSFFCFSYLTNKFGVKLCLASFPLLLVIGTSAVSLYPNLWLVFFVVSLLKALMFSFFDPLKEILYVPTSDAIKYKAASWIEVFGARLAKALGSFFNRIVQKNVHDVNFTLLLLCLVLGAALLYLVWTLGTSFEELIEDGRVIGTARRSFMDDVGIGRFGGGTWDSSGGSNTSIVRDSRAEDEGGGEERGGLLDDRFTAVRGEDKR